MSIKNKNVPDQRLSYKRQSNKYRGTQRSGGSKNRQQKSSIRQQQPSILIQTCCPNCRYRFQVVDQEKLQKVRTSMEQLQRDIKSSNQQVTINKKYQLTQVKKKSYNNTDININIRNNQNLGKERISPNTKNTNKGKKSTQQRFRKDNPIYNKIQKHPSNEHILIDETNQNIYNHNSFQIDKKKISPSKERNVNFDFSVHQIQKDDQMCQLIGKIEKISQIHSSKPAHFKPICKYCGCDKIPSSTIMLAAKSNLANTQLQMMSNYVQMSPDTPGYIKFLRLT